MNRLDRMFVAGVATALLAELARDAAAMAGLGAPWSQLVGVAVLLAAMHFTQRWALRTRRDGL